MTDDSWRTGAYRQHAVNTIEEAIRFSGINSSSCSIDMESYVFQKAKNKNEYLNFVSTIISNLRERKMLKSMSVIGNRSVQGQQMSQQMSREMPMHMQNPNVNQLPNQMQNQMTNQIKNQVGNQMGIQVDDQMPMQIQRNRGNINMQDNMRNEMMGSINQIPRQEPGQNIMRNPLGSEFEVENFPRNQTPPQMFNHPSPSQSVQSPAGLTGQAPVASPTLATSPGSQLSMMGAGGSLNTPEQPIQSPIGNIDQNEQVYREKVRQLSKYIEPLRKMIARMGNAGKDVEKMSKLLEILSNPQQRMPLDTLLKCEVVLEKLDFERGDSSVPTITTTHLPFKDLNPLLEAVSNNLNIPVINHTLHRTFRPTLEALFGSEIKLVPSLKRMLIEEPTSDIPDILQGEIARLNKRFKVYLDQNQQPGSKTIQLTCWLDDKHLPCIPPVFLTIPEGYPKTAPTCHMAANEYNATQFLSAVRTALLARIKKLPTHFSVTHLLNTWEMSVRQPCVTNPGLVSTTSVLMGL